MSEKRPTWHQYFLTITRNVAERSTCCRAKVGAVIVRDKNILATGYNGAPAGLPHCIDVGCLVYTSRTPAGELEENCFRTIHAEINAIAQAAKNGGGAFLIPYFAALLLRVDDPFVDILRQLLDTRGSVVLGNDAVSATQHPVDVVNTAAAGIYALEHHVARLAEDHTNAKKLARLLQHIPSVRIAPQHVETNIVIFDVVGDRRTPTEIVAALKQEGVLINAIGGLSYRAVTHLNVTAKQIDEAGAVFTRVLAP